MIKVRDQALEHGYIVLATEIGAKDKRFTFGATPLPPFPEALFPFCDGRSEGVADTDVAMEPQAAWVKERLEAGMGGWKNLKPMQIYIRKAGVNIKGITDGLDLHDPSFNEGKVLSIIGGTSQIRS